MSSLRILVCGDRDWSDYETIRETLRPFAALECGVMVIDGACKGADTLGHKAAKELDMVTLRFPANWKKHGKAAGPIRNQQMIDEGNPMLVLAFHTKIAGSKGTKDMVNKARRAGIPTCVFPQRRFA